MIKKRLKEIFKTLNLTSKIQANAEITAEEWNNVRTSYRELFGEDLDSDVTSEMNSVCEQNTQFNNNILDILGNAEGVVLPSSVDPGTANISQAQPYTHIGSDTQSYVSTTTQEQIISSLSTIVGNYNVLMNRVLPDNTPTESKTIGIMGGTHTGTHVFGIEHDMFSTLKRWNKITVNPAYANSAPLNAKNASRISADFFKELSDYSASFSVRVKEVVENPSVMSSFTTSLGSGDGSSYFDQFITRRQDAIIAHVAKLKDIYSIFPRRFGIQDRELMTNAFFGSFSQGYQAGKVFKGSVEIDPEIAWVDDAMFKAQFVSYKELERNYLGYLNKEGSAQMKWSFIEWCMVNIAEVLMLEQAKRKVWGCYVKPETDKPGHYLNAGNGVLTTLVRYYHENKILPFFEDYFVNGEASAAAMYSLLESMYNKISERVDDINEYEILLNANHKKLYRNYMREQHAQETDWSENSEKLFGTDVAIRWVPYMYDLPIIIFQKSGNLQAIENIPGEMLSTSFESEMESVIFWSVWKEGFSAYYAGKGFAKCEDLIADDMKSQEVFFNMPSVPIDIDSTFVKVVNNRFYYTTGVNTASKAITDIKGAKQGAFYVIETSSGANPQTIAQTGKFADIVEAYTPTAVGDYIKLVLNFEETKFRELERRVGGVRKINKLLQPNITR